ncbi:hypothetical protein GQ600_4578 [Phytophthora cactorum]|nr:hypothetical protein GQ600_4578 [Phytophthora cactorum]
MWVALAREASETIRAKLKSCSVVINADEALLISTLATLGLSFCLGQDGSSLTLHQTPKKGVSRNVFIYDCATLFVMTATHYGTLARRFSTWCEERGDACVNFHPSHWMDRPTAKQYVVFLLTLSQAANRSDMGCSLCSRV